MGYFRFKKKQEDFAEEMYKLHFEERCTHAEDANLLEAARRADLRVEEAEALMALHGPDVLVIGTLQGRFSLEQQQVVAWLMETSPIPIVHVILGVPFDYFQTRDHVDAALCVMGSRSVMVEAAADVLYGAREAQGVMLYDLTSASESVSRQLTGDLEEDRCVSEGIVCSGGGARGWARSGSPPYR